jgi:Cupredoxin-like domain
MTTIAQQEITAVRADSARLERTFAMTLVGAGCWAMVACFAYLLAYTVFVYAPATGDQRIVATFLRIFPPIAAILGSLAALALFWSGARRRAWFWWAPVIVTVLIEGFNAQDIPYDLARPGNVPPFVVTVVLSAGALATVVGGIVAFLEVRRGRAISARSGRVGWLAMAGIGVVVGAAATALLGSVVPTGGPPIAEAPTTTGFITTSGNAFVGSGLEAKDGELLGLIITNPQDAGHSFDIDSLGIHVQLSPHSSTAVLIRPTEPGRLEFYCSVHTHRDRGMVGAISVD